MKKLLEDVPPLSGRWLLAGVILHLLISMNAPLQLLADANWDDQLYLKLAAYILGGQWLGPYDGLTLQKGLGAPLFMALSAGLGLPFRIAQSLAYTLALVLIYRSLIRLGVRPWLATIAWFLSTFSPHFWDTHNLRASRDQILATLTLWLVAFLLQSLVAAREKKISFFWTWSLAAGWMLGWAWNTREESPWLLVPVTVAGLILLTPQWRVDRKFVTRFAVGLLCTSLGFQLLNRSLNWMYYGSFATIEVWEKHFGEFYGALARVQPHHEFPTSVPVPKSNIPKIRAVSPTFDKLMAHFPFQMSGVPVFGDSRDGEFISGWWMSGLRLAGSAAGLTPDGPAARETWKAIAREVNEACMRGQLSCSEWHPSVIPPVTLMAAWRTLIVGTLKWRELVNLAWLQYLTVAPRGSVYLRDFFSDFLNTPLPPEGNRSVWRLSVELASELRHQGLRVPGNVDHVLLQPLASSPGEARAEIHIPQPCDGCVWWIETMKGSVEILLDDLERNPNQVRVEHHFSSDRAEFSPARARARATFWIVSFWRDVVQWLLLIWLGLGLGLLWLGWRQVGVWALVWAGLPLLTVYARLGVLAYTEVTSFRTTTSLYYSPMYALLFLIPAFCDWRALKK